MPPYEFIHILKSFDYRVALDIFAVAWLIYRILLLAKGTRAIQIIFGLIIFFTAVELSDLLHFYTLNWLLRQAFPLGPVAIVILFLPELRHTLEEFGRPGFWGSTLGFSGKEDMGQMINNVVSAVSIMSIKRIGALIVFERDTGLEDIISTGTRLEAETTAPLIGTIFYNGTPLHDGAVIIRESRIIAAGCILPLTASPRVDATVHTRHKAALGMSEESDAVVVVVSEETGTISIAVGGKLIRGLRDETLKERLFNLLQISENKGLANTSIGIMATKVGGAIKMGRGKDTNNNP